MKCQQLHATRADIQTLYLVPGINVTVKTEKPLVLQYCQPEPMSICADNMLKRKILCVTPLAKHDCCVCNRTMSISHATNKWSTVVLPTINIARLQQ